MTTAESFASNRFAWRSVVLVVPALAASTVLSVSCGASDETRVVLGKGAPEAGPTGFNPGSEAGAPDSGGAGMCPTTQCPPGRATCPDKPFPCQVDLLWDDSNCGACGNTCSTFPGIHAKSTCVEGACVLQCQAQFNGTFANCNGLLEDGCEISISTDKNNCGGCGIVCAANEGCIDGKCVCSIPASCGACGTICPPPTEPPFPIEWNAGYHCVNNQCNQVACNPNFGDCNSDFAQPAGDGCETYVLNDSKNCGACGVVCQQFPGVDPVCNHGVCEYPCLGTHADCDQRRSNGCETNITDDPANCGGCGIRCDAVEGQACVEGRCTMKECQVK